MKHITAHSGLIAILIGMGALYLSGQGGHGMLMWDEAHYAVLGRALAGGHGYVRPDGRPESLRPPVLPAAVATVLIASPNASDKSLLRITVAAALLTIAAVYGCALLGGGWVASSAATLLFATFPETWRSTSFLLTELPFMLFYTPAVFFFHRGLHSDPRNFVAAWTCFALALLTRYTAVLFGPTCVLLVAVPLLMRDQAAIARMRSRYFFMGPAIAALLLAPIFTRNGMLFGDPLVGFRAAAQQLPNYSQHTRMPWWHYLTLLPTMLGWLPTLALPLAIGDALARRDRLGIDCLIAATVIVAWLSQYGWKEPRLVSAALPFFAILIGLGLQSLWGSLESRAGRANAARSQVLIAAVGAILLIAATRFDPGYARIRQEIAHWTTLGHPSFRTAMAAVEGQSPASAVLMGPNCFQISWYARRTCYPLPSAGQLDATQTTLANYLSDIDYVVATSFERGQPAYLEDQWRRAERQGGNLVETFRDGRYWTKIIPAALLRQPPGTSTGKTR